MEIVQKNYLTSPNLHDKFTAVVESGFIISIYKGELYKLKKKYEI